jgi:hypothetical protein
MRKEADFKIENTIQASFECGAGVWEIINKFSDYIKKETLTERLGKEFLDDMFIKEIKVNEEDVKVGIRVAGSIITNG